jgi:outer membrane protein
MMQRLAKTGLCILTVSALASQAFAAPIDLPSGLPNLVGVGIGSTTEYSGGKQRMLGVMPGLRYETDSGRLLEWYGPYAQYNFGNTTGWQWGPAVSLRLGRNNVDDAVVSKIHDIDTTVEAGGFFGYEYIHSEGLPYRLRGGASLTTNGGMVYNGARLNVSGSFWVPVSHKVVLGTGLGASWVSADFNRTYYGVTAADSAASGLAEYQPGGGLQQIYGWIGALVQVTPNWYAGALVFNQHMMNVAADSPIIRERGERDQLTYGLGVGYAWH